MWRIGIVLLAMGGCATFPELDRVATRGVAEAPFPDLRPLDELLAGPVPRASVEVVAGIDGRVAGLRARAARLSGPVVSASTRARMRAGVRGGG